MLFHGLGLDLFSRLSGEEDDGDEDEDAKEDEGATRKDRKIKWEDEGSELSDSGSQSASTCETDSEGSSSPEPAAQRPRSIRFHHSKDISPDNVSTVNALIWSP